jgi:hypothetical protein
MQIALHGSCVHDHMDQHAVKYEKGVLQALQATAAAEAERKANSSKARVELEEQMKERQVLQLQQQVTFKLSFVVLHSCRLCAHVSC